MSQAVTADKDDSALIRTLADILRLHGMEAMGEKLIPYPRENRWDEMAALIPEEMIDLFAVVADYKSLPKALEER